MDFAKKQLEKYGWKEGKGLGRNEDGIANALKPKLKFDNSGVGHNPGEQFTNNWWERVFNNAAGNIKVHAEDGVVKLKLKSPEPIKISTDCCTVKDLKKNNPLTYGSFLKTSRLTDTGVENYEVKVPEPLKNPTQLTDEQIFAACSGRTAHKGARHGLKLSGKLARIEKQEKLLLKKMRNVSISDDRGNLEKKIKKIKKHKEVPPNIPETETSSSSKKKDKKKRKSVSFNEETVVKYYTPDLDTSYETIPSLKDENSNDSLSSEPSPSDEGIEQDVETNNSEKDDNHRSFEEVQPSFSDLSKAERKKLKKKRKQEKKFTATIKFIEGLNGEPVRADEKSKKRKFVVDDVDMEGGQNGAAKASKKKKYPPEKIKRKKEKRREKMMNVIVQSMDSFCKISDDE